MSTLKEKLMNQATKMVNKTAEVSKNLSERLTTAEDFDLVEINPLKSEEEPKQVQVEQIRLLDNPKFGGTKGLDTKIKARFGLSVDRSERIRVHPQLEDGSFDWSKVVGFATELGEYGPEDDRFFGYHVIGVTKDTNGKNIPNPKKVLPNVRIDDNTDGLILFAQMLDVITTAYNSFKSERTTSKRLTF